MIDHELWTSYAENLPSVTYGTLPILHMPLMKRHEGHSHLHRGLLKLPLNFPPIVSEPPPCLTPYFHDKYPTQKPTGETELSYAFCLLTGLPCNKALLFLQKTFASFGLAVTQGNSPTCSVTLPFSQLCQWMSVTRLFSQWDTLRLPQAHSPGHLLWSWRSNSLGNQEIPS